MAARISHKFNAWLVGGAQVERHMCWFRGLHDNLVLAFHERHPCGILDAGCGTGGFLYRRAQVLPEYTIARIERRYDGLRDRCKERRICGDQQPLALSAKVQFGRSTKNSVLIRSWMK